MVALVSSDFSRQLDGYRLTTAEITYHRPDLPRLLQQFIWQKLDIAPRFPALNKFLDFWETKIEGRIHSVRFATAALVHPAEYRLISREYPIN
ncbi:MAG: Usg family protein [Alphaproteobacteria bacterium]|nr:Usg family protein [Alphaproteobacteria bacterium]